MRRLLVTALAASLLGASLSSTALTAASGAAPTPAASGASSQITVGVNYHALKGSLPTATRSEVLNALQDAGTTWVRIDADWAALQPTDAATWDTTNAVARLDRRILEVNRRGMKVLLVLSHAPKWASGTTAANGRPTNPADFANAVSWLTTRYSGAIDNLKIDAIELWNEPNKNASYAKEPSASWVTSFAELVKTAGPAAKSANPQVKVVLGGLSASDTTWLNQLYAVSGVIGTYDALGVHPYQSPGDAAPELSDPKYAMYYMTGMKALADLMDSKGDPAEIWATEFGWTAHDNTGYPDGVPNYARGVTAAQQADYLLRGLAEMASLSPRITAAFWAEAIDEATGDPMADNYGLITLDLVRKPVWDALACAQTGDCPYVLPGDSWRFQDAGSDLGTDWRELVYDDAGWKVGPTEAGYGDHDEATLLDAGTMQDRALTVYARHTFAVSDPAASDTVTLRLKVDDGAVAYLNDKEVARFNLPSGEVTFQTRANQDIAGAEERRWREFEIPVTALRAGENVLAVEVHQSRRLSEDLSFDAGLYGSAPSPVASGAPGAPTDVTATVTRDTADVSWTAPASQGDSEINGYEVTSIPSGLSCTTAETSCAVSGLTPGQQYVFVVRAHNDQGEGLSSDPSAPVGAVGPPAAPLDVVVEPGSESAIVSWTPPADGGSPIISYTVQSFPPTRVCTVQSRQRQPFCILGGLTNGQPYTFAVHATNAIGDGPATLSDEVTPLGLPGPPTNVTAVAGDGQATVQWTPSTVENGSPILGYRVRSNPDGKYCVAGAGRSAMTTCTVDDLTNGTAYTFTVRALNSEGLGEPSVPSAPVTPTGTEPPPGPDPETELAFGVNYQPLWEQATDSVRAKQLDALAEAGTKWVRIDTSWAQLQPSGPGKWDTAWGVPRLDQRIREVTARGMKVMLMFYWAPEWSSGSTKKTGRPGNPQDYANAAAWVAKRYDGKSVDPALKAHAFQILNEPNISGFWDQEPTSTRVSSVADIVKVAGPAIRAANADIKVVSPATSYTDVSWYSEFYGTPGIIGTYDVLAVHPYQSPGDAPPDAFDPKWATYYLKNVESLVALMDDVGDPAAIWLSEYGWTSHDNSGYSGGVPNYARGVTEQQQADYLVQALQVVRDISPRVQGAFWYNTWNGTSGDPMQDNFGMLKTDLSRKPVYSSFACVNRTGDPDKC